MLQHGAAVDHVASEGYTPLLVAAERNYVAVAQVLLKHGARVDATNARAYTPLMIATANGFPELVSLLLAVKEPHIDAVSASGTTALAIACATATTDLRIVNMLLQRGADPTRAQINGNTPLHSACRNGILTN